ncbi:B-box zinc finger protein [Aliikangiella sp. G2MR2-5]|uniref:B-box zinc finger protein n=1 Tax=Aliikangiella sp. G2MR2-5 TaxID=2788943 RepID=UPI0018A9B6A7|nr:B-box zinc finger protein [Aliikangiella sp. G2MR2-5]
MEYCKYHPNSPATFWCENCQVFSCDNCTDEGSLASSERCFKCGAHVESLGATYTATPFWRRLEDSFRYPLNASVMGLIVAISLMQAILSSIPMIITLIVQLALFGSMIKYCFDCLEKTSEGLLTPPDVTHAYSGGLGIAVKVIAMMVSLVAMIIGAYNFLGEAVAGLVSFVVMLGLPAVLINFGLTRQVLASVDPIKMVKLISAIGLPYGLIIAFLMIMSGSITVLSELTYGFSFASALIESVITYYYMVVMFHMMGYMIFQYQGKLGFVARAEEEALTQPRNDLEKSIAQIGILVKEGNYSSADRLFIKTLDKFANDKALNNQYFDFLIATKSADSLKKFATQYIEFLDRTNQPDKIRTRYKQIVKLIPDFVPQTAFGRFLAGKACHDIGEHQLAVKLFNGMKKLYPDFELLPEVFEMMAESLGFIPKLADQAEKYRQMAKRLAKQRPTQKPSEKADFAAKKSKIDATVQRVASDQADFLSEKPAAQEEESKPKELPPLEFKL